MGVSYFLRRQKSSARANPAAKWWVFVEPVSRVEDGAGEESGNESADNALELERTPGRLADLLASDSESDE